MPRKTDKRVRLVEAAKLLMHQQGFNLTTLADIALKADVPLGNVYYYFKTKEAIGEAVIDNRAKELKERLASLDAISEVRARLDAFLQHEVENSEATAGYGCPVGGLCQELAKQGGPLAEAAANLLTEIISWSENQFSTLGFKANARELATQFVAQVQGIALLTNTFQDTKLNLTACNSVKKWIDSLEETKTYANTSRVEKSAIA